MPDHADATSAAVRPDGPALDSVDPPRVPQGARRGSAAKWLALLALVLLGASAAWYRFAARAPADLPDAVISTPAQPASADVESLRRSLEDAARINRALREQVLGLTQRVGLVEDGLAGVERGAAPGVDAVRLAEADFLLRLGEERLRLFGDVNGARNAFELADAQLIEVSDPRATSVRQTLALERDALAALAVADLPAILGRLDGLAAGVASWPLKGQKTEVSTAAPAPNWWKRLSGAFDRYFRVRRVDPAERASGGPLLRERLALDLSRARLLLLRSEGAAALTAIESVRAAVRAEFDDQDAGVAQAIQALDEVRSAPLAPVLPTLGEARRELARIRGVVAAAIPSAPPASDVLPASDASQSGPESAIESSEMAPAPEAPPPDAASEPQPTPDQGA